VTVLLGAVDPNKPGFLAQKHHVRKGIQHPEYATATVYHDTVLIELDRTDSSLKTFSLPACLYTKSDIPDFGLQVTGWEATSNSCMVMSI
jgi:secreted trypsin-like serine protease